MIFAPGDSLVPDKSVADSTESYVSAINVKCLLFLLTRVAPILANRMKTAYAAKTLVRRAYRGSQGAEQQVSDNIVFLIAVLFLSRRGSQCRARQGDTQ